MGVRAGVFVVACVCVNCTKGEIGKPTTKINKCGTVVLPFWQPHSGSEQQ